MKFSICTTFAKSKTLEEVIQMASEMELDGIEIWDGHIDDYLKRNRNNLEGIRELLDKNNLKCCCISPYFNFIQENESEKSFETAKKCVEYSKKLGNTIIRTFIGNKPSYALTDDEKKLIESSLNNILRLVKDKNIFFALETHFGQPTDNADYILNLMEDFQDEHLKVIFDGFNFYVDKMDMMDAYEKLEKYLIHYHIKNYLWEQEIPVSLNNGDVDFSDLILKLKKKNDNVFLSFEYFCVNPKQIIAESIKWINAE